MDEMIIIDKEYLSRPLVEDVEYLVTSERIKVSCPHTVYLQYTRLNSYAQKDILTCYSEVIKLSRELGVKIHYTNKYKTWIVNNWGLYTDEYKRYDALFCEVQGMIPKLKKRGLHKGTSDDLYLKNIYKKTGILDTFYYRNSTISGVNSIYRELQNLRAELINEKEMKKSGKNLYGTLTDLYL